MNYFQFECDDVFGLGGRGAVFRGCVVSGVVSVGECVYFKTQDGMHSAKVVAIELDQRLITESVKGREIGLLLDNFDIPKVNAAIQAAWDPEIANTLEPLETLLKITLPVVLISDAR